MRAMRAKRPNPDGVQHAQAARNQSALRGLYQNRDSLDNHLASKKVARQKGACRTLPDIFEIPGLLKQVGYTTS